jgi:hypothetical protein
MAKFAKNPVIAADAVDQLLDEGFIERNPLYKRALIICEAIIKNVRPTGTLVCRADGTGEPTIQWSDVEKVLAAHIQNPTEKEILSTVLHKVYSTSLPGTMSGIKKWNYVKDLAAHGIHEFQHGPKGFKGLPE